MRQTIDLTLDRGVALDDEALPAPQPDAPPRRPHRVMRTLLPLALALAGVGIAAGGVYAATAGLQAGRDVRAELRAQNITTPPDAALPGVPVDDVATLEAMAQVIDRHAREATGGRSFAELGRFVAADGGETDVEEEALRAPDGSTVRNPLRTVAFEASSNRAGLYTSIMAFRVSDLVVGLGALMVVLGLAFAAIGGALRSIVERAEAA